MPMIRFRKKSSAWNRIASAIVVNNNKRTGICNATMNIRDDVISKGSKNKIFVFYDSLFWSMKYANKSKWWHDTSTSRLSASSWFILLSVSCIRPIQLKDLFNRNWIKYSALILTMYGIQSTDSLTDFIISLIVSAKHTERAKRWA